MKKAIVTGANGFIGSAVVKELLSRRVEVVAVDRAWPGNCPPREEGLERLAVGLDGIASLKRSVQRGEADVFYHFAWAGSAGPDRADTALQLRNAQWTVDCLRVAHQLGCRKFVCAGSIMEHETIAAAFAQGNRPGLGYIYGSGKLAAHTLAKSVAADLGIELLWAKITNAYGAGERSPRLVNTTIQKILRNEPLQFTAGTQNYDFVYISDVAKAFYLIGENGKPFCDYLIGSSQARPLREFMLEMKRSLAPEREFVFGDVPFTGVDLPLAVFDCTQTEKDTGFRAEVPFFDGVRRTMEWIRQMEEKVETL